MLSATLRRVLAAACLLFVAVPIARADIVINLGRGDVTVRIPSSYDPAVPAPLILLLHGYTSSGAAMEAWFDLGPLAEQEGFLYMAPDGSQDLLGLRFWNATDACCDFFDSGIDDAGYLKDLIDEVKNQLNVDEQRVHILGHSNGGFMAYRMACDHAEALGSIASLAGATYDDESRCSPVDGVHTLQIHGTNDDVIFYNGGAIGGNSYPSAVKTAETWATYDDCTLVQDDSCRDLNLDASIPGRETTVIKYDDACTFGGSAELWTINGGGHSPALSNTFSSLVVKYFLSHPKPGTWNDLANALDGTYGPPVGTGIGDLNGNDAITLRLSNALENASVLLVVGLSALNAPFAGGEMVPALDLVVSGLSVGGNGELELSDTWPANVPSGFETYYQFWLTDPVGVAGFAASNALLSITP